MANPGAASAVEDRGDPVMRASFAAGSAFTPPQHVAVSTKAVPVTREPDAVEVRAGDTVSAIAARHGLRTADVLRLNGLDWSSVIRPGDVLRLVGTPAPTPPQGAYTVRPGDTVSAIAAAHGMSTQAILEANGLAWSSVIYPGQTLRIPAPAAAPAPSPSPAPAPAPSPTPAATHTVSSGDTVSAIAAAHGVSIDAVLDANGLSWSAIIYPGQVLTLPGAAPATAPATVLGLDAEQVDNARLIIRIGRELGVPDRGIAIALGTAMQESWIRNLDWGDRDSLGLFQQRPSTGWGSAGEVRDRERSIRAFFGGPSDPNGTRTRGLLDIPGWETLPYAQAAQAVQLSAHPDRYARWEQPSFAWLSALG